MKSTLKMKAIFTALLSLLIIMSGTVMAQVSKGEQKARQERSKEEGCYDGPKNELRGPFGNYHKIPDLTESQKEEIKAIRVALIKENNSINDKINEKEASLKTLIRSDNPDIKAIEKLIDEVSLMQATKRKNLERSRQQIRAKLTTEQRLWFDQNSGAGMGKAQGTHHTKYGNQHPAKKR